MPRKLITGIIIVGVVAAAAFLVRSSLRPDPVAVAVWEAKPMAIDETVTGVATGFIEPAKRVGLQPEISGRIIEVLARRGDRVKTGQILVVLDDSDFKNQLLALDAAIPLFEARLAEAKAHASQIGNDFERAKRLSAAGTITVQQFETAKMAFDLGTAELAAAESALRQARVNRDIASSSRRKTLVRAPFDGIVLECDLVPGQLWGGIAPTALTGGSLPAAMGRPETAGIAPEAGALLTSGASLASSPGELELADDSRMFVVIDVDENEYGKLKLGQTADLTFEALGRKKMTGSLAEIYPFISRALDRNRTSRLKIELVGGITAGIVPGMSVNAEIMISSRTAAVAAPTASILVRPRGKFVYLVAGGKIRETAVGTGSSNWEWTEITSGLAAGDRIASPPENVRLKDGMRVVERNREP